jgi:hypothetical protein
MIATDSIGALPDPLIQICQIRDRMPQNNDISCARNINLKTIIGREFRSVVFEVQQMQHSDAQREGSKSPIL